MPSLLRQIVAGPRVRHPEAGLDLCYVTDRIIATSGPSGTYPRRAYRNPLDAFVKFLDLKHGSKWAIWEFRAEGTGYPDEAVHNRIWHFPWPDHHPPPFALVPAILTSMRDWLQGDPERVVVVHCKAGKGRSGTASCAYLIAEEGWKLEDALNRFTERRMRPGFGSGVSIPSQIRWVGYVDQWVKNGKVFVEHPVEVLELHFWGLRDGVKVAVKGFIDQGRSIKTFHTFTSEEREIVRGVIKSSTGVADVVAEVMRRRNAPATSKKESTDESETIEKEDTGSRQGAPPEHPKPNPSNGSSPTDGDVVFRPKEQIILLTNDINVSMERRNRATTYGLTMVTSVAHVWFNTYFEADTCERHANSSEEKRSNAEVESSGVFTIEWDALDGIKGSIRKGSRAFDRLAVVWRALDKSQMPSTDRLQEENGEKTVSDSGNGPKLVQEEQIRQTRSLAEEDNASGADLGVRPQSPPDAAPISRANSLKKAAEDRVKADGILNEMIGVKSHGVPEDMSG